MEWQYTPYTIPLLVSAGVSVLLAGYVLNRARYRQHELGLLAFMVCMVAAALWSAASGAQVASVGIEAKFLWRVVGYVGHNLLPISLFAFAVAYTGNTRHVSRRQLFALAAFPMGSAVFVAPTNPIHHLLWTEVGVVDAGAYLLFHPSFGPWYWVNTAYNYVLVIAALVLFVRLAASADGASHGRQVAVFLLGLSPPFVSNVAWTAGLTPVDLTPIAFSVMGVAFLVDIVHFRLLDVLPVARGAVIEELRDGYIVVDGDGRVVDTNPTSDRIIDHPDPIGEPANEVLPPAVRDALGQTHHVDRTAGTGDSAVGGAVAGAAAGSDAGAAAGRDAGAGAAGNELVVPGQDGDRYYDVQISALSDSATGGRLVLLRDVTERRAVEERYRRLIENASDIVTTLDADGRVTYMSPSMEHVLGHDPDRFVGADPFEFMHPDDRDAVRSAFDNWAGSPGASGAVEYRFRHADGSWRWMEGRVRNLLDSTTINAMIVNSRDVTERKRREHDLQRQNERLEEFTGVVSHDLRNPLAVISGYTDLVRETGDEQYLDGIDTAVDRMDALIEDLLQLARQGREIEATETVRLDDAVQTAWQHVDTGAAALVVDGDLGTVEADRDRLTQLLENLFRNSIEHGTKRQPVAAETDAADAPRETAQGSSAPDPSVTVTVSRVDDGFVVGDDGQGIPAEVRETVFERGYTTNDRGTGFGLSIVRTIADAHGWAVRADESDDGGAAFVISGVA